MNGYDHLWTEVLDDDSVRALLKFAQNHRLSEWMTVVDVAEATNLANTEVRANIHLLVDLGVYEEHGDRAKYRPMPQSDVITHLDGIMSVLESEVTGTPTDEELMTV